MVVRKYNQYYGKSWRQTRTMYRSGPGSSKRLDKNRWETKATLVW